MLCLDYTMIFFFKQKTAYEVRISGWSSDVCSSDLDLSGAGEKARYLLLAFAIPFAEKVGGFGGDEIRLRLPRDRFGEQGLAGSWRTIEQEAFGRPDTNAAECVEIGRAHV